MLKKMEPTTFRKLKLIGTFYVLEYRAKPEYKSRQMFRSSRSLTPPGMKSLTGQDVISHNTEELVATAVRISAHTIKISVPNFQNIQI
jgi:hypothetical protein